MHAYAPAVAHEDKDDDINPLVIVVELRIVGQYVIWELATILHEIRRAAVEVINWKTGDVIAVRTCPGSSTISPVRRY